MNLSEAFKDLESVKIRTNKAGSTLQIVRDKNEFVINFFDPFGYASTRSSFGFKDAPVKRVAELCNMSVREFLKILRGE